MNKIHVMDRPAHNPDHNPFYGPDATLGRRVYTMETQFASAIDLPCRRKGNVLTALRFQPSQAHKHALGACFGERL